MTTLQYHCGRFGLACLLILALAMAAEAAPNPSGVTISRDVVRGSFTQHKYLAELDQPLVSKGHYTVAANHGLIWRIEQPVQVELVIGRHQLVQRSNGHEIARIEAGEQPALQIVAAILLAVFQADTARLEQYFDVQKETGQEGGWHLMLTPKTTTVSQFIQRIGVRGDTYIRRMEIQQSGGDRSIIELQTSPNTPDTLSAAELAQFAR